MKNPVAIWAIAIHVLLSSRAEAGKSITSKNGQRFYVEIVHGFTWSQSIDKCTQINMELISMDSEEKTQEVNNLIQKFFGTTATSLWTGGHDHNASRHFEWISTGEAFSYTNWQSSQPSNANENCVYMDTEYSLKWGDFDCNGKAGFVCEQTRLQNELVLLKESMGNQTNLLMEQTEELDSFEKKFEKFLKKDYEERNKIHEQRLEEIKQKQEELIILQKSSEQQMAQMNQTRRELQALKSQLSDENEIKEILKDIQRTQLQNQNEIIGKFTKSSDSTSDIEIKEILKDLQKDVVSLRANIDISNPISYETQTALLKAKTEELEDLKKTNIELFVALQKCYAINTNHTAPNKNYNIHFNKN